MRVPSIVPFLCFFSATLLAQSGAAPVFDSDSGSRGLLFGWGHSWKHGLPGYGKTETDIEFFAFHPQMGWFVADLLELYGEGTLLGYHKPQAAISAGAVGIAGRLHFWNDRRWVPYATFGVGVLWTSLEAMEIDRTFNFQVVYGAGVRWKRTAGPGWIFELRNHHISNAGTAGENLGVNAAVLLIGIEWIR